MTIKRLLGCVLPANLTGIYSSVGMSVGPESHIG